MARGQCQGAPAPTPAPAYAAARKADCFAVGDQLRMRVAADELPVERHLGVLDCIGEGMLSDSKSIQDDEYRPSAGDCGLHGNTVHGAGSAVGVLFRNSSKFELQTL